VLLLWLLLLLLLTATIYYYCYYYHHISPYSYVPYIEVAAPLPRYLPDLSRSRRRASGAASSGQTPTTPAPAPDGGARSKTTRTDAPRPTSEHALPYPPIPSLPHTSKHASTYVHIHIRIHIPLPGSVRARIRQSLLPHWHKIGRPLAACSSAPSLNLLPQLPA
jgi:hypothetical protein